MGQITPEQLHRLSLAAGFDPTGLPEDQVTRLPEDLQGFVREAQALSRRMAAAGVLWRCALEALDV